MAQAQAEALEVLTGMDASTSLDEIRAAVRECLGDGPLGIRCEIVDTLEAATDPSTIYIVRAEASDGSVALCRLREKDTYLVGEVSTAGASETRLVTRLT